MKGLGEKTRWLLAYLEFDYAETNPSFNDWFDPHSSKSKSSYGLAFPNVPYLIDGEVKLTESEAINTYIIVKAGLAAQMLGSTAAQQGLVRMIEGIFHEIRFEIRYVFFREDGKKLTQDALAGKMGDKVCHLNAFVEHKKPFILGDKPSLADFHIAAIYYQLDLTIRTYGIDAPPMEHLSRIYDNLMKLEPIAKYLATDKSRRPFAPAHILKNIAQLKELHGEPASI